VQYNVVQGSAVQMGNFKQTYKHPKNTKAKKYGNRKIGVAVRIESR
jgi:hypothetical protein